MELAAWCDLRVAGASARIGCLERRWGVPLIDGGTYRLPQIVGLGRALDLILTGREIGAEEAERMGFVSRVVPDGQALATALALAAEIASYPWRGVVNDRRSVYAGLGLGLAEALAIEDELGPRHDLRRRLPRGRRPLRRPPGRAAGGRSELHSVARGAPAELPDAAAPGVQDVVRQLSPPSRRWWAAPSISKQNTGAAPISPMS